MEPSPLQLSTKQPRAPRKRNRITFSCGHCRIRKLKCNRATPCEACIKTGDAATCSYESRERQESGQSSTRATDKDALTSRVDRLESLLLSVVGNNAQHSSQNPSSSGFQLTDVFNDDAVNPESRVDPKDHENEKESDDVELLGKEFGVLRVEPTKTLYHGGQHWVSSIFQIQEIRDYLEANSDDLGRVALENRKATNSKNSAVSFLRGTNAPLTKEELLSCIPSQTTTDMLIARFFDCVSHSIPVVHAPTFSEEYNEHWSNPNKTEITWLGLLFSVLHHAELSFDQHEENFSQSRAEEYKGRTVQCLMAANYMEPKVYTIETLILHIYAEWMGAQDGSIEVSSLLGIAIRLAMRMGMHRDPRAHDSVTPFQGEMRRRVWAILRCMDIICSFQLSLPAAIHSGDSRCGMPRNIFDNELHRSMKALPPSRPLSEATEFSAHIVKIHLTLEFGKILAFAEASDDPTDDEITKYEKSLEDIKEMIPERLGISSSEQLVALPVVDFHRQRINIDRLYRVCQCVLHRTTLSQARHNPLKLRRRGLCIDAAMSLLAHQVTLCIDFDPSYAHNIRKRHMYTLTTHDFFTASMAIALDLYYGFESEPYTPSSSDVSLWGYDRRHEMIAALETATEFCKMSKDYSVEAANAYGVLIFIVAKARKAQWMIEGQRPEEDSTTAGQTFNSDTAALVSELGTGIFNGALSDFDWNLWNPYNGNYGDLQPPTQWDDIASDLASANEYLR